MDVEPAVQENAQHWGPHSVLRGTALATVKYPSMTSQNGHLWQRGHRAVSDGVHLDAMCGGTEVAATTPSATGRGQPPVSG